MPILDDTPALRKSLLRRLGISFFLFGLINNVLYVIILSAALDLVPPSTPKGIIAFCNIAPALVAKVGWPYFLKGRIRYAKRILGCCILSVCGMVVVAAFDTLNMRLVGISLASFSSGLGELTFLQLSTTYSPASIGGHSVGYFASGTGAAGLVGAAFWWFLRGLGVREGVGISAVLPFATPLVYFFVTPRPETFKAIPVDELHDEEDIEEPPVAAPYTALPASADEEDAALMVSPLKRNVSLSPRDKWELVRPMLLKYMLPLFCVYMFEYNINQGIAPTLLYPVPSPSSPLRHIITSIRDYYPLWQLIYQTTVFLSRSSISMGLPPLPARLISLPAFVQAAVLCLLALESATGFVSASREGDGHIAIPLLFVFVLIGVEGSCGGLAYVNVFYRINQEPPNPNVDKERAMQEREFKIGSMGFSDSFGILAASMLAIPTEIELCRAQIRRGKTLCQGL